MERIPKSVFDLIRRVCEQYPTDSNKAADEAEKRLKRLKDYPIYAEIMARRGIRDSVHDQWHNNNKKIKKDAKDWPGQDPKVVVGTSKAVQEAANRIWEYHIAGNLLGRIVCNELPALGDQELARANGYAFKGNLCHRLYGMVPKSKRELRVSEVLSEKKVRAVFVELQNDA